MKVFHGATVGRQAIRIYACKTCGCWQTDARGQPIKPVEFYCIDKDCNGTEFQHFPSKAEARAYSSLRLREKMGKISDLKLQVPYNLHAVSPEGRKVKIGKYVADFTYQENGVLRVIDVKGAADTHLSALKRRHVEAEHSITVAIYQA